MSRDKAPTHDNLMTEARRARQEGRAVFTTTFGVSGSLRSVLTPTTDHVARWSEMIEVVETEGWRLEHWSVAGTGTTAAMAYPVFRPR